MTDLAPFSLPGRFWRGNLHTHSTLSDGVLTCEQVAAAYVAAGYDFLMISEHFLNRYSWPIADTRRLRSNRFTTILGAEIHAPATSTGELWHIVAAGLPLDFTPPAPDENAADLARRAAATGAFIGIAHPAWSQLTLDDGLLIDAAHAVEIQNYGCLVECDRGDGWYLLDQLSNRGRRLSGFATDDAHFRIADQFGAWVHVRSQTLEPETLLAALKAGQYYSSEGPLLHELSLTRQTLHVVTSPVDTIAIVCGTSGTAGRTGRAITSAELDLMPFLAQARAAPDKAWFRVVAIDHAGRRAWSNPIWIDTLPASKKTLSS